MHINDYEPTVGDIIAFSGRGLTSLVVRVCTFSRYSHVGVVGYLQPSSLSDAPLNRDVNVPVLFESTTLNSRPCLIQNKIVNGVQAQPIIERVCDYLDYGGRAWVLPLSNESRYKMTHNRKVFMSEYLISLVGRPYDTRGALVSGTRFIRLLHKLFPQSMNETFCSALCHSALEMVDILPADNSEMYSPKRLIRYGIARGVFAAPIPLTMG